MHRLRTTPAPHPGMSSYWQGRYADHLKRGRDLVAESRTSLRQRITHCLEQGYGTSMEIGAQVGEEPSTVTNTLYRMERDGEIYRAGTVKAHGRIDAIVWERL